MPKCGIKISGNIGERNEKCVARVQDLLDIMEILNFHSGDTSIRDRLAPYSSNPTAPKFHSHQTT